VIRIAAEVLSMADDAGCMIAEKVPEWNSNASQCRKEPQIPRWGNAS
jgi:hypothetical protein